MAFTDQGEFDVRCEWGPQGVAALAAGQGLEPVVGPTHPSVTQQRHRRLQRLVPPQRLMLERCQHVCSPGSQPEAVTHPVFDPGQDRSIELTGALGREAISIQGSDLEAEKDRFQR